MKPENTTRRKMLLGLAAAGITSLSGCANFLEREEEPEPTLEPTPENDTEATPTEDDRPEETDEPEEEAEESEESNEEALTWETVLEPDRERKRDYADQQLIEQAVNGEKPGEDYGVLFEDPDHGPVTLTGEDGTTSLVGGYSHGKEYFDIDHFRNLDPSGFGDFLDILNDAVTLKVHELTEKEGQGVSGFTEEYSYTAELLIEEVFSEIDVEMMPAGNDGHGFLYVFNEDHGGVLVDSTSKRSGKIGTNVLQGRSGKDRIGDEEFLSDIKNITSAGGAARTLLTKFYLGGDDTIGFDTDLLIEIYEDIQNEAKYTLDKVRPMIATTAYLREYTNEKEEEATVITGSLDQIPSNSEQETFEAYKKELMPNLMTYEEYQEKQ